MSSMLLLVLSLVLILLSAALWLWSRGQKQLAQGQSLAHLERKLGSAWETSNASSAASPNTLKLADKADSNRGMQHWDEFLMGRRGGMLWQMSAASMGRWLLGGLASVVFAFIILGWAGLILSPVVYLSFMAFALWRSASKTKQKIVAQLPNLLEGLVRLINIGNSPQAAFQMVLHEVPEPLKACVDQAASSIRAGHDLDYSVAQAAHSYDIVELELVAAVLRMSVRYGGRTDVVLERVANYIQDKESAERELHALSAETRLSAWILALLPIGVGALIIVLNSQYFMRMWNDSSGRTMIFAAAALEALGAFALYRLARLK